MRFEPFGDRVVIMPDMPEKETDAGIVLPDQALKPLNHGDVLAVGPDVTTMKVGDHVLFNFFTCSPVQIDDEEFLLAPEKEVLGRIHERDAEDTPRDSD